MNVYVASSWRNPHQPDVVRAVRSWGHATYDFREPSRDYPNPDPLVNGFHWSEMDVGWERWSPREYREALSHPLAERGFASDKGAMKWAHVGVLLLPCGRSAHAEAGWMAGRGKPVHALILDPTEPELMYKLFDSICVSLAELKEKLEERPKTVGAYRDATGAWRAVKP